MSERAKRGSGIRWRAAAMAAAVAPLVLVACVDNPEAGTSTTSSSTSSTSSTSTSISSTSTTTTTLPDDAIAVSSSCTPMTVPAGEDGANDLPFAGLSAAEREFVAATVTVHVRWSGPPNADLAIALSGSDDRFAGLTVDGTGAGGDVEFRDDAAVTALQLPSVDGRGIAGVGRPDEALSAMEGEPLGDSWLLAAINFSEVAAAEIEACELSVIAVPPGRE